MMGERVHFWEHFSLNRLNTFKESKLERASLQGHYRRAYPDQLSVVLVATQCGAVL